jgi:hypothetical protein
MAQAIVFQVDAGPAGMYWDVNLSDGQTWEVSDDIRTDISDLSISGYEVVVRSYEWYLKNACSECGCEEPHTHNEVS